jgi:hypothetical protein
MSVLNISAADVPILGQAYTIKSVCPVVVAVCNCEAQTVITLPGIGSQAICPGCRRAFQLRAADANISGQAGAGIASFIPNESSN